MELSLELPPEREAVPSARHLVCDALSKLDDGSIRDDVALLVSELVANAVEHAGTAFTLRLEVTPDMIRIEVTDGSHDDAEPGDPGPDSERGRGLLVVRALSGRWGVTPLPGGKTVWCELQLPPGSADGVLADHA